MPRQARLDFPGTLHHVICRGIEKRDIVSDENDRDNFVERMGGVAEKTGNSIYAWAVMRIRLGDVDELVDLKKMCLRRFKDIRDVANLTNLLD